MSRRLLKELDFRVITTSKQTLVTVTYPGRCLKNPLCPIVALGLTVVQVEISNLTCTCFLSKEGKIDLEILFADVLDRNKGFPDQTNVHNYYRIAILVIFPNGLPLVYIKKLKFDLSLFLVKIDQEILFADVLDRKKGFPV